MLTIKHLPSILILDMTKQKFVIIVGIGFMASFGVGLWLSLALIAKEFKQPTIEVVMFSIATIISFIISVLIFFWFKDKLVQ